MWDLCGAIAEVGGRRDLPAAAIWGMSNRHLLNEKGSVPLPFARGKGERVEALFESRWSGAEAGRGRNTRPWACLCRLRGTPNSIAHKNLIFVTPGPAFGGFGGNDDWVIGMGVIMFAGVLVGGRIAAEGDATDLAGAEVNPGIACLDTGFTFVGFGLEFGDKFFEVVADFGSQHGEAVGFGIR